jgi:hypothetical protein
MLAKKIALGFGIALVFPMMIHFGVSTFVEEPNWRDYHGRYAYDQNESSQAKAERIKKQEFFDAKQRDYQRVLFSVAVPLGILAIVVGAVLPVAAIGTGLMFGGIFSVLDGYMNYWSELPDGARFISLLLAFIVLLWVGYRKLAK